MRRKQKRKKEKRPIATDSASCVWNHGPENSPDDHERQVEERV